MSQKFFAFTITSVLACVALAVASCSSDETSNDNTSSGGTSGGASSGGTSGGASSGGTSGGASSGGTSGNASSGGGGDAGGDDGGDSGTSGGLSQKCMEYCTCMADPTKCGNTGFPGNCGEECMKNENGPWDLDCRIQHCGYGPDPVHCGHALGEDICD